MLNSWLLLFATILIEVAGTTCIKFSNGFTKLVPTLGVFFLYGLSFWGFSIVVKKMEVAVAYAVWAGLGVVLVACIGFIFFGDKATPFKLLFISLIVAGVVGLNVVSHSQG